MGKYLDRQVALAKGGADAERVRKERDAELAKLSEDITAGLRSMSAPKSSGLLQRAIDFAIGAGAGADKAASQPEAPPVAQPAAPPAPPPQEEDVDIEIQAPQYYKAKFEGNYYLVPGVVEGKAIDRDTASELFVTGKLAPVAKSPSLDQIKKEEQRRIVEAEKDRQKAEPPKPEPPPPPQPLKTVLDHELDAQQHQFLTNERAIEVMNKYSPAPDFLKNSEHGRMFMRGQAVDALGYLGMKAKNYALAGKELPPEDKKKLKEMEYVAGYKSPDDGSWTQDAAELVGQMYAQFTDAKHNPFMAGLVGTAVGAAAGSFTGPGMAITGPMAGLAAGTASAANRSALIEGGNFFLEARNWKHSDGRPVSAREAAIATDLVGGVIGALEVANVGPYLKMFPVLNKFVSKKALVNNPAVKDIVLKAAKRVAAGAGTEAATETAQEIPGIIAGAILQDKDVMRELANPETGKQLAEVFQKTFQGTAVLGGAGAGARMAVDSYDAYKQKRREHLAAAGVDVEETAPKPPPKKREKKTAEPKPTDEEKAPEPAPEPTAPAGTEQVSTETPAPEVPVKDTESSPQAVEAAKPTGPSMVTIPERTKKDGTVVPASSIPIDPVSTPAAVATNLADGTVTEPIQAPASMSPTTKLEILNTTDEEGFGTVQHEDGTRVMAPKKIWHVNSAKPIKLDWLVRPAILMNDNSIYEGPMVQPLTSVTEPNIAKLNGMVESRRKAEGLAIRAGYILDEKNEEGKPVDVKDVGYVITGPEGTQAAGQPVWVSSKLVDEKFKGKHNSLQERLSNQLGENYENAAKTAQAAEAEKIAKKNAPLPPLAQDLLKRPYATNAKQAKTKGKKPTLVEVAQKKVVKSLANSGFDKAELESVVQEAVLDASRSVANTPDIDKKTPAQQQALFFSRLRAFTQDQVKKAKQGGSRRQHQKMREEGVQNVSLEAAGLENKPTGKLADTEAGVAASENKVATKVSANTPIKQAQARAEATGALVGKEARPGPVKVYTKEEIDKINRQIQHVVKGRKQANSKTRKKTTTVAAAAPAASATSVASSPPTPVTLYRQGRLEGKWWSDSKEYAENFGKKGSQVVSQPVDLSKLKLVDERKPGSVRQLMTPEEQEKAKQSNYDKRVMERIYDDALTRNGYDGFVALDEGVNGNINTSYYLVNPKAATPIVAPASKALPAPKISTKSESIKSVAKQKTGKTVESVPEAQAAIATETSVAPQIEPKNPGDLRSEAAAMLKNDEEYTYLPQPDSLVKVEPVQTTGQSNLLGGETVEPKKAEPAKKIQPRIEFVKEINSMLEEAVQETGIKGPELQQMMLRYGKDNDLLVTHANGEVIFNGISNIYMRMKKGEKDFANGLVFKVAGATGEKGQYIIFKPEVREGGYVATPEFISEVLNAMTYAERPVVPQGGAVGSSTARVGGNVTVGQSVAEQVAAQKAAEDAAREKAAATPKPKKEIRADDPPVVMGSTVAPQRWASSFNVGDSITLAKPSAMTATIVNPETGGVIAEFTAPSTSVAAYRTMMEDVSKTAKKVRSGIKVVVTQSGEKNSKPSRKHRIDRVIERGVNPTVAAKTAETGRDGEGSIWNESGFSPLMDDATRKIASSLKKAYTWTARALDVEHYWKTKDMAEIGFTIKNYFSRAEVEEKKAAALAIRIDNRMRELSGGRTPSQQYRLDVVLAAEDIGHLDTLDPDYAERVRGPAAMLRTFMDDSQAEFAKRGITLDFKNRMLGDLDTKIAAETDEVKKQELQDARAKVEKTEFVHIPYRFIFQKAMREFIDTTDPVQRKKKLAEFKSLVDIKRHALSIKAMIEKKNKQGEYVIDRSNINPVNIILNYGANKGHDHALLDIRDALRSYDKVVKIVKTKPKTTKEGYDWVQINQPKLELLRSMLSKEDKTGKKKLFIRKDAFEALNEVMGYSEKQTKYDKLMSLGKMTAFWNPFFLPIYNALQSIRGMTINPMHPVRTVKAFGQGIKDVGGLRTIFSNAPTTRVALGGIWSGPASPRYYEALQNGLTSKPFGNPFQQWRQFADQINGTRTGNVVIDMWRAFIAEFKHASPWAKATVVTPMIKSMYMASWHAAWQMDEIFRMASYNYLREYGHSPREAAQVSSALQGDYASIPPKTRKVLNKFLFTPTFKLATFKLYGTLMKSAMKVGWEMMKHPMSFGKNVTQSEKRYAQSMIGVFMVNFIFDWLLVKGLGFDRDEKEAFGRRYRKRVVTAEGTTKDLYLTLASSENVVQRYAERVRKSFFTPGVDNPFTEFLKQNRWELHPVYRNALSVVTNQGDDGPIWSNADHPLVAVGKGVKYFTFKTFNLLDAIQSRTEYAANDKQRALVQKQWIKDYGHGLGTVMNGISLLMGYDYLAAPVEQQMVMKLRQVEKRFRSEAYRSVENNGKVDPALVDWYSKEQQAVIKHYTNRLNEGKR